MNGDYVVKELFHINEYVDKYIDETPGSPYKITKETLLKTIAFYYGEDSYSEEAGKYIINKIVYNCIEDALNAWLPILKTEKIADWTNEIEFIEALDKNKKV